MYYLHTLEALEETHAGLASCGISVYAGALYYRLAFNPRRTLDEAAADLVVFPPFGAAHEPHYPTHGGGGYLRQMKDDSLCFSSIVEAAVGIINATRAAAAAGGGGRDKNLLFFASNEDWGIDRFLTTPLGKEHYGSVIFAAESFFRKHYRPGWDISLPLQEEISPSIFKARLNLTRSPPLLLTYMGNIGRFRSNGGQRHARVEARERIHDPAAGVLLVDHQNDTDVRELLTPRYPALSMHDAYWQLLFDSHFGLVIGGDRTSVSRYHEVVCSGTVPVLLNTIEQAGNFYDTGRALEPPLQQVFPTRFYAIEHNASDIEGLVPLLRAIPPERVAALRFNASLFCFSHFSSMERLADTVILVAMMAKADPLLAGAGQRPPL